jgi:hypothetical protein
MSPERGEQVAAALLLDAVLGEPPGAVHPTVLMGLVISAFEKRALRIESPRSRRLAGIVLAVSVPSLVFVSTRKILGVVPCKPRWMIGTALVSTTLSMRSLVRPQETSNSGRAEDGSKERERGWVTSSGAILATCRNPRSAGPPWNRSRRTRATGSWPPCSMVRSSERRVRWHTRP